MFGYGFIHFYVVYFQFINPNYFINFYMNFLNFHSDYQFLFGQHFENARFEFCKTFSEFFYFMNLLYVKLKGNQCSTLSLGLHSNSEQPPFLGWRMWVAAVFREGEQMLLKNMAYESIEHQAYYAHCINYKVR